MTELATSTYDALADRYLDRLAFGWQRRNRNEQSHVIDFAQLWEWDQSLVACGQGLSLTTKTAAHVIKARLEEPLSRGEFFAIALHALNTRNAEVLAVCIGLAQAIEHLREVYSHVMAWADAPSTVWALGQWAHAPNGISSEQGYSLQVVMTLAACRMYPELRASDGYEAWLDNTTSTCLHRQNDGACDPLVIALLELATTSQTVSATAIDLADGLLAAPDAAARVLAAELLLGLPRQSSSPALEQRAIDALLSLLNADGHDRSSVVKQRAVQTLAIWHATEFDGVLASLSKQAEQLEVYLLALGWSGSMSAIATLMMHLEHPTHARLAGAALSMLTGSLPARDGWQAEPVDAPKGKGPDATEKEDVTGAFTDASTDASTDVIAAPKPHADLPPPDLKGFTRWWAANSKRFNQSTTWLAGLPASQASFLHTIEHGKLAWRGHAARRLCAASGGESLNISAPAYRQRQWLTDAFTNVLANAA